MQTYYRNDKGEGFHPVDISSEDAIAALVQSATKNAVAKVDDIITNFVRSRVESAVENANIQGKVKDHLATTDIGELVDNAISNAVQDYNYDGIISDVIDGADIEAMVTEKVTEHLDECTIQVSLR